MSDAKDDMLRLIAEARANARPRPPANPLERGARAINRWNATSPIAKTVRKITAPSRPVKSVLRGVNTAGATVDHAIRGALKKVL